MLLPLLFRDFVYKKIASVISRYELHVKDRGDERIYLSLPALIDTADAKLRKMRAEILTGNIATPSMMREDAEDLITWAFFIADSVEREIEGTYTGTNTDKKHISRNRSKCRSRKSKK